MVNDISAQVLWQTIPPKAARGGQFSWEVRISNQEIQEGEEPSVLTSSNISVVIVLFLVIGVWMFKLATAFRVETRTESWSNHPFVTPPHAVKTISATRSIKISAWGTFWYIYISLSLYFSLSFLIWAWRRGKEEVFEWVAGRGRSSLNWNWRRRDGAIRGGGGWPNISFRAPNSTKLRDLQMAKNQKDTLTLRKMTPLRIF